MTMSTAPGAFDASQAGGRGPAKGALAVIGFGMTGIALFGMLFLPGEAHEDHPAPDARAVTTLVYDVKSWERIAAPAGGEFQLPAAAVPFGKELFVLDTGLSRVLKLDEKRQVVATFGSPSSAGLDLRQPMAMTIDGTSLYIANSLNSEVVVLDAASGRVERRIPVGKARPGAMAPRLVGLALLPGGGFAVTDGDNHEVIILSAEGAVVSRIGAGGRAGGSAGFNVPAAITADSLGNLYVVDTLNSRVVKLSPQGVYLAQVGRPGTTVGTLSRPKGVAVDPEGRIFVSDHISASVNVFGPDGSFMGLIGREDQDDPTSPGLFRAPSQLWLQGNTLYVADRIAGVVIFELGDGPHKLPSVFGH